MIDATSQTNVGGAVLACGTGTNDRAVDPPGGENHDPPGQAAGSDADVDPDPDPEPGPEPEPEPGAEPTVFARCADTCSALVDAVAQVQKLEASRAAWKAEFVDRTRILAVMAEEGVLTTGRSRSVEQRQDLALRSFIAELACTMRVAERIDPAVLARTDARGREGYVERERDRDMSHEGVTPAVNCLVRVNGPAVG